tara:strand:- start:137 stop:487 length:351 start_codon:yes stop_codon:yes gene_type:complete
MNKLIHTTACEKYLHLAIAEIKVANNSAYYSPLTDLIMRIRNIISKLNGSDKKYRSKPEYNLVHTITPEHAELFEKYKRMKQQKNQHPEYILDDNDESDTSTSSGGRKNVYSNKPK